MHDSDDIGYYHQGNKNPDYYNYKKINSIIYIAANDYSNINPMLFSGILDRSRLTT
jgi:hypothetical protein